MNHSKRSKSQGLDRLSELPDSIIFHIFWFTPMNDVVRTTILSKRWRNLWTTTPFLNFYISFDDIHKSRCFVNQALFRWNGARILKFKVNSCDESGKFEETEYDKSISSDMVSWVNYAKEKKVEELYMVLCNSFYYYGSREKIWWLSQCLYSCSSLKVLSFGVCDFVRNANVLVQLNQLKSLTITEGFGVDEHVVNQILSGSPRLEVFNLSFVDDKGCENLNIGSISLKVLSICKYIHDPSCLCSVSELTICSPNLETLKIEGIPFAKFRLINVSSLTHATIGFCGLVYRNQNNCDLNYIDDGFVSPQDYIGYKFIQILRTIPHVERVTLHYCCLKVLRAMKMRRMRSSFPTIKCLKIRSCHDNYEELVDLLEIFPQLERLVLLDSEEEYCYDDAEAVKYEANIPKSFLLQLRTIEVTWTFGESIFALVEILLKYARKLERIVLRLGGTKSSESLLLASKKLLKMPRSSNCTIDFLHD